MGKLVPFDRYEAVLLLDGYLKTKLPEIKRMDIVRQVSADLRKIAVNRGTVIDERYRNTNGIHFQMESMASAYEGKTIRKPASRLFKEVVSLYRNSQQEYDRLLREARLMAENKQTVEELFMRWLTQKTSLAQLSELYFCYPEIEKNCLMTGFLKKPLFETTNLLTIQKILNLIRRQSTSDKFRDRKHLSAMLLYEEFLKEHFTTKENEEYDEKEVVTEVFSHQVVNSDSTSADKQIVPIDKSDTASEDLVKEALKAECSTNKHGTTAEYLFYKIRTIKLSKIREILGFSDWVKSENGRYFYVEKASESSSKEITLLEDTQPEIIAEKQPIMFRESRVALQETRKIDFKNITSLAYTKPSKLTYFEDEIAITPSWTNVYVKIVNALYEDYPTVLPMEKSFTDTGCPDLGGVDLARKMIAPKQISPGIYLETNYSATDIVRKIKALLDICLVDYENVVIEYELRKKEPPDQQTVPPKRTLQIDSDVIVDEEKNTPGENTFYYYLQSDLEMAEGTCRSYVSAIKELELFAEKRHYPYNHLFCCSAKDAVSLVQCLMSDNEFIQYNQLQHHRFTAALRKLLDYVGVEKSKLQPISGLGSLEFIPKSTLEIDKAPYIKVLRERFAKGYRLNSALEFKRFQGYYEKINESPFPDEGANLDEILKNCGIVSGGKVFLPETIISEEIRDRLLSYIDSLFQSGRSSIYYDALFDKFSNDFLGHQMYNAEMLKSYLAYINDGKYYTGKTQLTKKFGITADPQDEIREFLKGEGCPVEKEVIFTKLSHIPQDKISQVLGSNLEFVRNNKSEYFHADVLDLSDGELENIVDYIRSVIRKQLFISGTELMDAIRAKFPNIYGNYVIFTDLGWRDALKYKLRNHFSFRGNIISDRNETLSMSDAFANLALNSDRLTVNELQAFAKTMGTVVYLDPVYENSLRVNGDLFVSKRQAYFQIEETDAILDRFCSRQYISITEVNDFGIFPDAGFPWTSFLLESYVAFYSKKYKLLHGAYNLTCAVGAIVKKDAGYDDFDDLLVDILARSRIPLEKASALDLLVQEGYIARRSYQKIEEILIRAKAQRNKKEE